MCQPRHLSLSPSLSKWLSKSRLERAAVLLGGSADPVTDEIFAKCLAFLRQAYKVRSAKLTAIAENGEDSPSEGVSSDEEVEEGSDDGDDRWKNMSVAEGGEWRIGPGWSSGGDDGEAGGEGRVEGEGSSGDDGEGGRVEWGRGEQTGRSRCVTGQFLG
jgi:hypothetical protein